MVMRLFRDANRYAAFTLNVRLQQATKNFDVAREDEIIANWISANRDE